MLFLDKKIVITGGSNGIGRACAQRAIEEGAHVLVLDKVLAEIPLSGVEYLTLDLCDQYLTERFAEYLTYFGSPDILINSAAIQTYGAVDLASEEIWEQTLRVNLMGTVRVSRVCLVYMLKKGKGSIVNVSSIQATRCRPNAAAYVASKGAISALTRTMALDYASRGVRVNCVEPAAIHTPLLEFAAAQEDDPSASMKQWGSQHPIGRLGRPEEVAEAIMFLASEKASFITGTSLAVDGGVGASAFNVGAQR